jgi:ABC-type lipoprotein release transport system permease subunit
MYRLLFKLAYKNALLRSSRTLLVVLMIAVSMSMMVSLQGLYDGITKQMIEKIKRSDCGEISIYAKGYRLSGSILENIPNALTIQKELQNRDNVKAVAVRLEANGLAATARKSAFSNIRGIDIKSEEKFGKFSEFLQEGKLDLSGRNTLVSKELAKKLKLRLGSKVIFSTQDANNEINSIALKVAGIIQTTNVTIDTATLFVDIRLLHKFLLLKDESATQIAIRTDTPTLYETLKRSYKELDVKSFTELNPMMKQMQEMMVIFNSLSFIIVMTVVFIGIMGVMYVSVLDRIREFGIMKSIGMHYSQIRLQIIFEALFIAVMGYIVGAILAYLLLLYLCNYGLDLSQYAEGLNSFSMDSITYAQMKLSYFIIPFAAIILAALASLFLPLRKLKHMNVVEIIKVQT